MVCLEMALYYDNKYKNNWAKLISFFKDVFPNIDESNT